MCHVLIIEDEPFVAMTIQAMLEEEGATTVDFAVTEAEAISAALANPPKLITSDVRLIEGTGPLALEQIHQHLGEIPVIFITGSPDECQPCNPGCRSKQASAAPGVEGRFPPSRLTCCRVALPSAAGCGFSLPTQHLGFLAVQSAPPNCCVVAGKSLVRSSPLCSRS
ncbi:response regulator [Sphingomonas sp. PL-96]|uniref:response regulator n=1 Tax=Sphingomonas sp. PL-96 TaxID=2887201 RepID=UPI002B4C1143|nr:response regulator [Sphingomonas sp. PL-96]MCC2977965.1 response regulator [Sphingomonas sp. PL-96]